MRVCPTKPQMSSLIQHRAAGLAVHRIFFRAMEALFQEKSAGVEIEMAGFEIYNETVSDLAAKKYRSKEGPASQASD